MKMIMLFTALAALGASSSSRARLERSISPTMGQVTTTQGLRVRLHRKGWRTWQMDRGGGQHARAVSCGRCERHQCSGHRSVSALQTDLRPRGPGRRTRLALPRPGQLLHRPGECARGQRGVVQGRTYGKKAEVPAKQWSTLRVVANGRLFEVYFNGTKLYDVEDSTFTQPGKVGVWTKADSVTQFDGPRATSKTSIASTGVLCRWMDGSCSPKKR
jgi:hypothetical protein